MSDMNIHYSTVRVGTTMARYILPKIGDCWRLIRGDVEEKGTSLLLFTEAESLVAIRPSVCSSVYPSVRMSYSLGGCMVYPHTNVIGGKHIDSPCSDARRS